MVQRFCDWVDTEVYFDEEDHKWGFRGKHYRRKGQAMKAAWLVYKKECTV